MIVPPLFQAAALLLPEPDPVPVVGGQVSPPARSNGSANHVAGDVAGNQASYGDVQAGAWYLARQGRDIRNPSRLSRLAGRALGGVEDTVSVRR